MKPIQLLSLARAYADHTGLAISTLATYAQKDGKFFDRLEKGGDCTSRVGSRVVDWFLDNWPADLEWPRDIPRPRPVPQKKDKAA